MKYVAFVVLGTLWAIAGADGSAQQGDRTITKVVKLLQKMLEDSTKDADSDKDVYAKWKCWADKSKAEKEDTIKTATETISLLENEIAQLRSSNSELSIQVSTLDREMTANKAAHKSAEDIRDASKTSYDGMKVDLETGLGQMAEALDVLKSIVLNQQSASTRVALLSFGSEVQKSLMAASAVLSPDQQATLESFLQAPLAAAASKKGDAITGILEKLHATFEDNLKSAQESEDAEKKAYDETIDVLEKAHEAMDKMSKKKKGEMGENDDKLSSKLTLHEETVKLKADTEVELEDLIKNAAKKAKNYEERKMLRANEDAAIAECISILNSDAAFESFGNTDATKTGATSFLQMRRMRGGSTRQQAETILERAATQGHSKRLARIVAGLRTGNPFNTVLAEIEKMKKTIAEEGVADNENKVWCEKERENSNADLDEKKASIQTLEGEIDDIDTTINDPKTGLIVSISDTETQLVENQKEQKDQTTTRNAEHVVYVKTKSDLEKAEDILGKAIAVLQRYYDQLSKHMSENADSTTLLQKAEPETYDAFEGQSTEGNKALDMLKFIKTETEKERTAAETSESDALSAFEESIKALKESEVTAQESLVKLKADLAKEELALEAKKTDLKDTTAAKKAIEEYLLKIKPGCDFIAANFDLRETNRATETEALDKAVTLIKDTPAYKSAEAAAAEAAAGKCKSECKLDTTSLGCKVCVEGTTKSDYCKKHPGTPGCQ